MRDRRQQGLRVKLNRRTNKDRHMWKVSTSAYVSIVRFDIGAFKIPSLSLVD